MTRPTMKSFVKNWIFQGISHASVTATIFKIIFEGIAILIGFLLLYALNIFNFATALLFLFLIHTVNWLINSSGLAEIMKILNSKVDVNEIYAYMRKLSHQGSKKQYINMIVIYGSVARNDVHATSDIDVIIVRRKGFLNAVRSWLFGALERTKAIFNLFPLDLSIIDDARDLGTKFVKRESPLVLYDRSNTHARAHA
jgi:hypothetical protein